MEKKITIFTVVNADKSISKSFTTKKLATDAVNVLKTFGVVTTFEKEVKTVTID